MWKMFGGRCIHHSPHDVYVHQNARYRWLTFNSPALQTRLNRHHPEQPGLAYINALILAVKKRPAKCCLLGLGGAGIAHALAPHLNNIPLIAVEHNPEVIQVASRFFMLDSLRNLELIQADAYDFISQNKTPYEHILIDLFDAHSFPSHCNTLTFFEYCKQQLTPEGMLAINLANSYDIPIILNHVKILFGQSTLLVHVKKESNVILFAYNQGSIYSFIDQLKQDHQLKKAYWDPIWGYSAHMMTST